jgi:haloalkane dehalogenase
MPTSNQLWRGVIERLRSEFTCFAVDLPGLGDTPGERYLPQYLKAWVERIDALRIKNNIKKWHVVGHDAGSAVAVQYAHTYPKQVGRLALLSPALFPDLRPFYLLEILRKPVLGELLAPLVSCLFWNVAMRRAARNEEGAIGPAHTAFQAPFSGLDGPWQLMRTMRWGNPREILAEIPAFLPSLQMPALLLYGLKDPAIPRAFVRRASTLIPNARTIEVDCGHFIPLNKPTFVASSLGQFFAST